MLACCVPETILSSLHESPQNNIFIIPVLVMKKLRQKHVRKPI